MRAIVTIVVLEGACALALGFMRPLSAGARIPVPLIDGDWPLSGGAWVLI